MLEVVAVSPFVKSVCISLMVMVFMFLSTLTNRTEMISTMGGIPYSSVGTVEVISWYM